MGVMTPEVLQLGPGFALPLEAVTQTFAILAKRRAGKSNAAVVLAEELYKAGLPWVAVDPKGDWWGVRASGDGSSPGLAVIVFGGLHGDVPLEPSSGELVADLIVDRRLTCVLDVSEMSKAEQRHFLADFASRLYKRNREPRMVIAEEADEYLPQRVMAGDARLVGAWESLIKRGGFRGLGVCLLSQRSASLNKDGLSQVETLIAMRTPSPQDRKAILGWVEQHDAGRDVVADLPGLADGEAWVFSPQWLQSLTKVRFRRRETFDSGATPTVGGRRQEPPQRMAEVDLDAIRDAMAETIDRARASDPTELRREVKRLRGEIEQLRARQPEPILQRVEVPVVPPELASQLTATVKQLAALCAAHSEHLAATQRVLEEAIQTAQRVTAAIGAQPPAQSPHSVPVEAPRTAGTRSPRNIQTESHPPAPASAGPQLDRKPTPVDGVELRSGARRMVEALGRMAPLRLTKSEWGTVARLKTSGGTWSTYLSNIRQAGLLDESTAGFTLSDRGFAFIGGRPAPMTAAELQDHYRGILRAGAGKMLDALIAAYPSGLIRDQLGDAAELTTSGGTFSTYLSDLTRNGLCKRNGDVYQATEILIHGADADPARATSRAPRH